MLFRSAGIAAVCAATVFSAPALSGQLLDLYGLAQDADPTIAAARATAESQRAQAGSLRAGLFPQLQATGSFTRERDETTTGNVVIQEATVFANNTNYGLRLEQPLFDAAAFARPWCVAPPRSRLASTLRLSAWRCSTCGLPRRSPY